MSLYQNLDDLLKSDKRANDYYMRLPGYTKEALKEQAKGICSWHELQRFTENYLAGDN